MRLSNTDFRTLKTPFKVIELARKWSKERKPTKSEIDFESKLNLTGIAFQKEHPIINGKTFYLIDFYIPSKRLCVEIDGGYHIKRKQQKKDKIRDQYLQDHNYLTWRMTNKEQEVLTWIDLKIKIERIADTPPPIYVSKFSKKEKKKIRTEIKNKRVGKHCVLDEIAKRKKERELRRSELRKT